MMHFLAAQTPICTSWNCLPAYRWNGNMSFHVNQGDSLTGAAKSAMDTVGGVFWAISGFMWSILLDVVRWATTTDLLSGGAKDVNGVAANVGNAVLSSGAIPSLILLIAVIVAVVAFLRRGIKGLSHVLISCIFLGGAFATTAAAATNSAGSPLWFTNLVSQDTGYLAGAIGTIAPKTTPPGSTASNPNCQTYVNALTKADASGGIGPALSSLWLQSYAYPWATAQFGSTKAAQRVYCHWLEWTNSEDVYGESYTAIAAGYPHASGNNIFAQHDNARYGGIYGPFYWPSTPTQAMFAWAMCKYTGSGWQSPHEFYYLSVKGMGLQYAQNDYTWGQAAPTYCSGWYNKGYGIYGQSFGPPRSSTKNPFSYLATGSHIANAVGGNLASGTAANANTHANSFFTTWNGSNPMGVVLGGFVTMFVSLFFGIVIGSLALGTLIAQLIILVVMGLLPLLFLVLAVPSVRRHGLEIAKAGIGLFLAKAVFTLVISLFVLLTIVIDSILMNVLGATSDPLATTLLMVLAPLVAFFVLHRLARMLGFGHIFSVRGALATTGAFALGDMMGKQRQARENRYASNYAQGRTFHQRGLTNPSKRALKSAAGAGMGAARAGGRVAKQGGVAAKEGVKKGVKKGIKVGALAAADAVTGGAASTVYGAGKMAQHIKDQAGQAKDRIKDQAGQAKGRFNQWRSRGDNAPPGTAPPGGPTPAGGPKQGPNGGGTGPGGVRGRMGMIPNVPGGGGAGGRLNGINRPIRTPFTTSAVGTTAAEHRQAFQRLRGTSNAQLALQREPNNPKDPNAVAVMHGQDRVGYLGRGLAGRMAPQMDAGGRFDLKHEFVTHPDHPDNPGLRLHIAPRAQEATAGEGGVAAPIPAIPLRNGSPTTRRRDIQPPRETPPGTEAATARQQARARRGTPAGSGNGQRRRLIGNVGRSGQHSPGRGGARARSRQS